MNKDQPREHRMHVKVYAVFDPDATGRKCLLALRLTKKAADEVASRNPGSQVTKLFATK